MTSETALEIVDYLRRQPGLSVKEPTVGQPVNQSAIQALEQGDPREAVTRLKGYLQIRQENLDSYKATDPPEYTAEVEREIENLKRLIASV